MSDPGRDGWVFLSGPMGSGKSTVGPLLADRLGVPFVDLDARIEARAGRTISEIFVQEGESFFRDLEAEEAMRLLLEPPGVLALGGGTVVRERTRRLLLDRGALVTLHAAPSVLAARVGTGDRRPLATRLAELVRERDAAYRECHVWFDTTHAPPEVVAMDIVRAVADRPLLVPLGARSYRVHFEALDALAERVERIRPSSTILVTDRNVDDPWGRRVADSLDVTAQVVLEPGEENKTIVAVERIWEAALEAGIDRDALVVGVGGGVVGDLAAFAASTLLRGVDVAHVPTSLLAMVDASVGGKTGFDRPRGKNLIGTFHQPLFVLTDVATLRTLPEAELRSGLAEVVKSAWLDSDDAVTALERDADALIARDEAALLAAIRRSVALKARVVAADEREGGSRALLNLGHTVGHALEAARGFGAIRHGEAVSLGMVAAVRVAAALGEPNGEGERLIALLERLGLPTDLDGTLRDGDLAFLRADKKTHGGRVRFVVPGPPGGARLIPLEPSFIEAAL